MRHMFERMKEAVEGEGGASEEESGNRGEWVRGVKTLSGNHGNIFLVLNCDLKDIKTGKEIVLRFKKKRKK